MILRFSRISHHRMSHAPAAHISAIPALMDNGNTNRGSDDSGQMYYSTLVTSLRTSDRFAKLTGVQIKLRVAATLAIARAADFFSLVCPHVEDTHPRIILLTPYVPIVKTHMAKYLAPTFIVAQPSTNPKIATPLAMVMCQVRSL